VAINTADSSHPVDRVLKGPGEHGQVKNLARGKFGVKVWRGVAGQTTVIIGFLETRLGPTIGGSQGKRDRHQHESGD
jgi:hypothetical protein